MRRTIVAFMVAAVASGVVPGGGATAVAAPAGLPDQASASAAAARFDRRVEVTGLTSETSQVFANPGGTFTAVLNARPVRARQAGGAWAPVDPTLRRAAGGRVTATTSPLRATLSGGGTGPLFVSGDRTLTWPRALPVPALDGDTAVYREALPGVDLTATLDVDGVVTALSVKSREAAGTAELAAALQTLSPDPDADLARLTAADAVYPAVVAPAITVGAANWTMINERHPDQSYWSYDRGEGAKVGYVQQSGDGWERYRSIWTFPMENLRGKHVLRAWFSSYLKHTYSCADTWTDLYLVNSVNAGTTWANHSGSWPWSSYLAGANNSDCRDAGRYSEWGGDKVTKAAQDGTGWGTVTLGLRAGDEGTINTGWKKFDENRTALSVEYNSYPQAPDQLSVEGKVCGAQPLYVGTTSPTLRARPRDADGQIHDTYFAHGERESPGGRFVTWESTFVPGIPAGAVAQYRLAGPLADGKLYAFHSQSHDGIDPGEKSAYCEFHVDVTRPHAPPAIATADGRYPADGMIHGGVGVSGDFTLAAAGVADVAGYLVGVADPPAHFVPATALGGTATAGVTPEWRGTNTLYVRSVDRAGNQSATAQYHFRVGSGAPPAGRWKLDEPAGPTLADTAEGRLPATLSGGALGAPGRLFGGPTALAGGTAATTGPVVGTAESFSVAAWVRSTAPAGTAVTQEGAQVGGFALGRAGDRWVFSMPQGDSDTAARNTASSAVPVRQGVWTHLAGTYDSATRKLTLYVDGRHAGEAVAPSESWAATGPLVLGRGRGAAGPADPWQGELADVQVWPRRIYLSEVTELANVTTPVGEWLFEEESGVTAFDTAGFGRHLTFPGGTHPGWGRREGHGGTGRSIHTGGRPGTTQGPVTRSTTGFAISAWVKIDQLTPGWQAAVAGHGSRTSPFFLQYAATSRKWAFAVTGADVDDPVQHRAYSTGEAVPGRWTHLVGVHDPGARQVRLYVDGQLASTVSAPTSWDSTGPLIVGQGRWNGADSDSWVGGLDDVRVLAGVPTDLEITALHQQ